MIELKENDVYLFRYKPEVAEKKFPPYHCFDGKLVVRKLSDGDFLLCDTYWGSASDSRSFRLEKALEQGELTFYCNLDDLQNISEHEQIYYADEDIFNLSRQHGCYKHYAIKTGTKRSKEKMIAVIMEKISGKEQDIEYANSSIGRLYENLADIESGKLDIYING